MRWNRNNSSLFIMKQMISLYLGNIIPPHSVVGCVLPDPHAYPRRFADALDYRRIRIVRGSRFFDKPKPVIVGRFHPLKLKSRHSSGTLSSPHSTGGGPLDALACPRARPQPQKAALDARTSRRGDPHPRVQRDAGSRAFGVRVFCYTRALLVPSRVARPTRSPLPIALGRTWSRLSRGLNRALV